MVAAQVSGTGTCLDLGTGASRVCHLLTHLLLRTIDSAVRQALPFTTRGMGDTLAVVAYKLHTLSARQPATWEHANEAFNIISSFQDDLHFATGVRKSPIVTSKGRLTRGLPGFGPEISEILSLSAMAFLNRGLTLAQATESIMACMATTLFSFVLVTNLPRTPISRVREPPGKTTNGA